MSDEQDGQGEDEARDATSVADAESARALSARTSAFSSPLPAESAPDAGLSPASAPAGASSSAFASVPPPPAPASTPDTEPAPLPQPMLEAAASALAPPHVPEPPPPLAPEPAAPAAPAPRARPRAGWLGNLAPLSMPVAGALAGALSAPGELRPETTAIGFIAGGIIGFFAAPFARLAHRWPTEWIALGIACFPWLLLSIATDISRPYGGHGRIAMQILEAAPFAASISAAVLAFLALTLATLLHSRSEGGLHPSRAALAVSALPAISFALVMGYTADAVAGVLAIAIVVIVVLDRVASAARADDPRSLSMALAACTCAGLALAAITTAASSIGLREILELGVPDDPELRRVMVHDVGILTTAPVAPLFAGFPVLALLWAFEARGANRRWPRVAFGLALVLALEMLWLDARNGRDVARHVTLALQERGLVTAALR